MQTKENVESSKTKTLRLTMWWLKENYEYCEGVSIPRKILYENYIRYCSQNIFKPINSATFGKIIRQQFPQISTRRLGVRGQSKYHYHSLAIKVTSVDYNPELSGKICSPKGRSTITSYHPKNRNESIPIISISLQSYDDISESQIKSDITNFLIMYQTHSQQILDSLIQGLFNEVETFLISFWKGCPDNFRYLFNMPRLISCVVYLDIQVYLSVFHCVLPSTEQMLPKMYLSNFVNFLCNICKVLSSEIPDSYYELKSNKLKYLVLFKETCLNSLRGSHLLQFIFPIFENTEIISQILDDFQEIILEDIICRVVNLMPSSQTLEFINHFQFYFEDFENILENDFSVVEIMNWCKKIFNQTLSKNLKNTCLGWSNFLAIFLSDLLLEKSSTFAYTNLLFMWMEHLLFRNCVIMEFKNFNMKTLKINVKEQVFTSNAPLINTVDYNYEIVNFLVESPQVNWQCNVEDGYYGC